jgi:hypothetical protein
MGFDVASFFAPHADTLASLSMLGAGSIDQVLKAMEGVERKLNSVNTNHAELADRLLQLEQKGTSGSGERIIRTGGLGEQFVKAFAENAELFNKTRSVRLELKAAGDAITTTSGRTLVGGGVGAVNGGVLGLQNAIPQVPASGVPVRSNTADSPAPKDLQPCRPVKAQQRARSGRITPWSFNLD